MPVSLPEIIPSVSSRVTPSAIASDTASAAKSGKAADAARQFEGLMIAQMLRDARESAKLDSDDGDDGGDSTAQNSTMMDLADQQFAQLLAKQGGIGLGNLAAAGLKNAT